jgi:L-ascorbate metabolism protein UlaG (beta-lactamase superfamily)
MAPLPDGLEITWLGHATFKIKSPAGTSILIDPWLSDNPTTPDDLKDPGDVDVILVTHGHGDHTGDLVSIAKSKGCPVVAMVEIARWLPTQGVDNVIEMNKGGTVEVAGIKAHMVHAVHSSSLPDGSYGGEAAGYVIELEDGFKIYHAGDTVVFSDMALIGKLLEPDLALLPIGDHYTMGPRAAAEAIRLLDVKTVVPMHYATFPPLVGRPEHLRDAAGDVDGLEILEIEPGETLKG